MAKAGIGVIPEDRHDSGVVLDMTVAENLVLVDQSNVANRGLIDRHVLEAFAIELIEQFGILCSGPHAPMWSLSGGNQQRVVLARELAQHPLVLVAAQPTRGLDVGAIEYMGERLTAAAEAGVAVLLISSELEEILDLSHRIVVMHSGRIVGEMSRADVDIELLGLLMGGAAT
jgi:simple sugar transport system ATP-binding protein